MVNGNVLGLQRVVLFQFLNHNKTYPVTSCLGRRRSMYQRRTKSELDPNSSENTEGFYRLLRNSRLLNNETGPGHGPGVVHESFVHNLRCNPQRYTVRDTTHNPYSSTYSTCTGQFDIRLIHGILDTVLYPSYSTLGIVSQSDSSRLFVPRTLSVQKSKVHSMCLLILVVSPFPSKGRYQCGRIVYRFSRLLDRSLHSQELLHQYNPSFSLHLDPDSSG